MKVKEVMSTKMRFCTPEDTGMQAAELMKKYDVGCIPVVESEASTKLIGTITDRDICLKVVGAGKPPATTVGTVMTKSVVACSPDDTLLDCESLMQQHQVRRIPVVDKQGHCVGIVAQADIAMREPAEHVKRTVSAISQPRNSHAPHAARTSETVAARVA